MKDLIDILRRILNPFRVPMCVYFNSSGFTGGYSDSSPSDLFSLKILIPRTRDNLNNRGC
jgi:hypothetical protein